ncbi:beta-ketoacyl-ACP synthase 3 [Chitinispirillales bacterium ANBcel5]|uniref:beta-ketoacyl-ACP synthase 3 n=1 Tax=Cellulosispirillum alkaliphilum TaxID=3039283 RepID=UPI002A549E51|nr:beta-ketoacyl-ACP synthase 3 [Chitinispirillales bacterium ANBcel5]
MTPFKTELFLPAQAAAETEATIIKWLVAKGESIKKGQYLAEVESAKSTFEFEAPCDCVVETILCNEGDSVPFEEPVMIVTTADSSMASQPATAVSEDEPEPVSELPKMEILEKKSEEPVKTVSMLGIGTYLPSRIVKTKELLAEYPDITEEYIFGVTGIKERRWAADEKPSDMAYEASVKAIEQSGLNSKDIDAIVVSTTTPDVVMPSTACILQGKLGIRGVPAFDLNAACSGWLYGISVAKGLICSGVAKNVLVTAVDMQSRVLDKSDRNTYFLFGDGAGATVVSASDSGHLIKQEILTADSGGLTMARRHMPGYDIPNESNDFDPWVRLDGRALFKFATESFSSLVRELIIKSQWQAQDVRWVVPHQANGRIIKAAAKKSGVPFEKFYLNIDRVGNTSSASIPIALQEIENGLQKNDKVIFCTVGAGITAAGLSLQW